MTAGSRVETLFERYLEARERGETPDVGHYLDEAGDERDALGSLIDAYLRTAPVRAPTEELRLTMLARLHGSTPLTEARTARGLRVDDLVDELERRLSVPGRLRARLRTAYQRLEGAQLDPGAVDATVWAVLASVFGGLDVKRLAATIAGPATDTGVVYARMRSANAPGAVAAPSSREIGEGEPDIVDRLFYGAS